MSRHKKTAKGVAVVEFTLGLLLLVPLLLGTLVFGFRLVNAIQMDQITRDVGRMYTRGINFRNPGPIQNAQTMSSGFDLSANGTSVLIFSQIRSPLTQTDCDASNAVAPVIAAGTPCVNLGKQVFLEQVTVGNTNIGASGFGTPPLQVDYTVSLKDQGRNSAAQVGASFTIGLNTSEYAYVAEMWNKTPSLQIAGMTGQPYVYSRAIF